MSKGFAIALATALMILPCTASIRAAKEQAAETEQKQCEKTEACSCTDCKCAEGDSENCTCTDCKCAKGECTDSQCTESTCSGNKCADGKCAEGKGKCGSGGKYDASETAACQGCSRKSCENGSCELFNCCSESRQQAICECVISLAAGGGGECQNGTCSKSRCCKEKSGLNANRQACSNYSEGSDSHISGSCWLEQKPSILGCEEQSLFGAATNFHSARHSDAVWHQIALELSQSSPDEVNAIYSSPGSTTLTQFLQASAVIEDRPVTHIQYTIQIVNDRNSCMHEYEPLRRGAPIMTAESKTLLPAMRMLERNELIEQCSSPRIICSAGEKAELQIDGETSDSADLRIAIASRESEDGLVVELRMESGEYTGIQTQVLIERGQSIVQRISDAAPSDDDSSEMRQARYIIVTPEIVN